MKGSIPSLMTRLVYGLGIVLLASWCVFFGLASDNLVLPVSHPRDEIFRLFHSSGARENEENLSGSVLNVNPKHKHSTVFLLSSPTSQPATSLASCSSYNNCFSCMDAADSADDISCGWCDELSQCMMTSNGESGCPSKLSSKCRYESEAMLVAILTISLMVFLCCGVCYFHKVYAITLDTSSMTTPLSRLFVGASDSSQCYAARIFAHGKDVDEWDCVLCGAENKPNISDCVLCGTDKEFSIARKAARDNRRAQKRAKLSAGAAESGSVLVQPLLGEDTSTHSNIQVPGIKDSLGGNTARLLTVEALTPVRRADAVNYRRLNWLTLRQKGAHRRKLWRRYYDPTTGTSTWIRKCLPSKKIPNPENQLSAHIDDEEVKVAEFIDLEKGRENVASNDHSKENTWELKALQYPDDKSPGGSPIRWSRASSSEDSFGDTAFRSDSPGFLSSFNGCELTWTCVESGTTVPAPTYGNGVATFPWEMYDDTVEKIEHRNGRQSVSFWKSFTAPFIKWMDYVRESLGRPQQPPMDASGIPSVNPTAVTRKNRVISMLKKICGKEEEEESTNIVDRVSVPVDLDAIAALPFREKQLWFANRIASLQIPSTGGYFRVEIRRSMVFEDSLAAWANMNQTDLHRWHRFAFTGEVGVDAGGLEREWFDLIINEAFSPSAGFFLPCGAATDCAYTINPLSAEVRGIDHLAGFLFIGRVLGRALMGAHPVAASLCLPLRKQITGVPVTFSDLEFVDSEAYRSLQWLRALGKIAESGDSTTATAESVTSAMAGDLGEASIAELSRLTSADAVRYFEGLCLDFTVTYSSPAGTRRESMKSNCEDVAQIRRTYNIIPDGSKHSVVVENLSTYLAMRFRHRLLDSVAPQLRALLTGLFSVIPPELLSVFDAAELEPLLCGLPVVDVKDWKHHTEYGGEYASSGENHPVIRWFWEAVESMRAEERVRLLQYTTGAARLPAQGFKALQSNDGRFRKFNIASVPRKFAALPRAHTCFNKLDLPLYTSYEELQRFLSAALTIGTDTGFSIE